MMQEVITNSAQNHFARYSHIESELVIDGCEPSLLPDLSVMIPTFRRPHLLKEAIESVVNQTVHGINIEIVIVDNDAESNSMELATLVESFIPNNIRLFRNKDNIGMFGNWNRCIELARAPKLTILNDDDLLHPDFINAIKCYLPSDAIISCYSKKFSISSELPDLIENSYNVSSLRSVKLTSFDLFLGMWTNGTLGTVLEKEKCIELGGFDDRLYPMSDWAFFYIYQKKYGALLLDEQLSFFRWNDNESMKIDVIRGQIIKNYEFRLAVCASLPFYIRPWYIFLAKILRAKQIFSARKLNGEFSITLQCRQLGVSLISQRIYSFLPLYRVIKMLKRLSK